MIAPPRPLPARRRTPTPRLPQSCGSMRSPSLLVRTARNLACTSVQADSGVKDESSLCMSSRQAISYSSFIGESIPVEYQDFGVTPMLLVGKPPWLPPGLDESFAGFRDNAITRYKEKNKRRKIGATHMEHMYLNGLM